MPDLTCPTCGHTFTLPEGVSVSECPACGDALLVSGGSVERAEGALSPAMWYYADADGGRVGPVTEPRAIRLVQRGVIRPETLVWRQGMPDWRRFAGSPLEMIAVPQLGGDMADLYPVRTLPTGLAVAGMVTGIAGIVLTFTCIGTVLGLPLAIVAMALSGAALQQVKAGKGAGRGMAIAGLTCSLVTLGLLIMILIFWAVGAEFSRPFAF